MFKSFEYGCSYGKNRAHVAAEVQSSDNTTLAVPEGKNTEKAQTCIIALYVV